MNANIPLSIILPVYNAQGTLSEAIESVLNQTNSNWELIIIDDYSTDNSLEIAERFANKDSRIKVLCNSEKLGPAETRNKAIENANGDYLGFLDADDILAKNYIERMLDIATSTEADIIWCQYYEKSNREDIEKLIENHLEKNRLLDNMEAISLFFHDIKGIGSLWNKLYATKFIKNNNLKLNKDRVRAEDWEFNLLAFEKINKMILISDALYYYIHQNGNSVMASLRLRDYEMMWRSISLLQELNIKYSLNKTDFQIINTTAIPMLEFIYRAIISFSYPKIKKIINDKRLEDFNKKITFTNLPVTYKILNFFLKYSPSYLTYLIFNLKLKFLK